MFNCEKFLILYGVDAVAWARKHDLEPFRYPCSKCGKERRTTLPFATDKLRGLVAPTCGCGNTEWMYVVVAAKGDLWGLLAGKS